MGTYLEKNISNNIMNYFPDEGHISLIKKNAKLILGKLKEFN